ncbi:hypothetical protein HU200_001033 [Digitaria exilis]|uniref:Uncharacterized protein n=1 Tax=Digitaria exilis TaxID=1010633 RepID=A0A835KY39_9POAL|nr:hypothetical protein HU200_001033 [Digitaria exilis]
MHWRPSPVNYVQLPRARPSSRATPFARASNFFFALPCFARLFFPPPTFLHELEHSSPTTTPQRRSGYCTSPAVAFPPPEIHIRVDVPYDFGDFWIYPPEGFSNYLQSDTFANLPDGTENSHFVGGGLSQSSFSPQYLGATRTPTQAKQTDHIVNDLDAEEDETINIDNDSRTDKRLNWMVPEDIRLKSLADKKIEAARLTHETAQEQTKCKMLETYTQLLLAPTVQLSEDALAERNLALENMRLALFHKICLEDDERGVLKRMPEGLSISKYYYLSIKFAIHIYVTIAIHCNG